MEMGCRTSNQSLDNAVNMKFLILVAALVACAHGKLLP
jgi:hypothetical protein